MRLAPTLLRKCIEDAEGALAFVAAQNGLPRSELQTLHSETPSEIFSVFALNEFIVLALHDRDRRADFSHIACRIIRLRFHH